ncbi:MAG: VOC family protein [Caldilineaceae bacterium]|nr:VOC family protein [Caldilineaceae bacterium]
MSQEGMSQEDVIQETSAMCGMDHIALGVEDMDERIDYFTRVMGLQLKRTGTRHSTGSRIALLADPVSGFKIELIETLPDERGLLHLAFRVDDVNSAYENLLAQGFKSLRGPHTLAAAKAETALLEDPVAMQVQIINYQPDSPDL